MSKIKIGFIGYGRIADLHILGYQQSDEAEVVAVCGRNQEAVARRCKEWNIVKSYTDYRDLLNDPEIDAVEILTPQKTHEQMVIEAAQAGKHIMVQKPMTIDLASADRMLAAVNEAGIVYKVIENYVYYPPIVQAKKWMDEGRIGEVMGLRIRFLSGSSGGWEIPAETWGWRMEENAEGRGMQTFDHGHHMWALAWRLLGPIERVCAWIDSVDGVIDCPATIMWKYKDAKKYGICDYNHAAELEMPSDYYACDEWVEITGSKGMILINRCTGKLRDTPPLSLFADGKWSHPEIDSDWGSGFKGATHNFISALKGREAPYFSGEEARDILKMALAIIRSAKERREVYLDELEGDDPEYTAKRIREEKDADKGRKALSLSELKEKKIL